MKHKRLNGADLFAGAGGFTAGFLKAAEAHGYDVSRFVAVNHWKVAVATHSINYPQVEHILDEMAHVDPLSVFPSAHIDFLLASPECIGFSRAAGGMTKNPQSRASAGHVLRWARDVKPRVIILENVREFMDWGPLTTTKNRKGEPILDRKTTQPSRIPDPQQRGQSLLKFVR